MPEPSSNFSPANRASSARIDWSIRTMADDLAELKKGGTPHTKIISGRPTGEPRAKEAGPSLSAPPPPAVPEGASPIPPPPPSAQTAPPLIEGVPVVQTAPRPRPIPPPRPVSPERMPGKEPPPIPPAPGQASSPSLPASAKQRFDFRHPWSLFSFASSSPFGFRRYLMPGGIGVITLAIFVLVIIGFQRGRGGTPEPTPTPPLAVEGEALNEIPSASVRPTPSPTASTMRAPLASDSRETVTATPQTLLPVLSAIALKPRPPRTLTELTFPGISTSDVLQSLALDSLSGASGAATSTFASTTRPVAAFFYLYMQEERFSTTTHPARLVAVFEGVAEPAAPARDTIESTLMAIKQNLWLGIPGDAQTTLDFQEAVFSGVAVRYVNFSQPDLTLDYAFVPQQNLLLVATSREAMLETVKRVTRQ